MSFVYMRFVWLLWISVMLAKGWICKLEMLFFFLSWLYEGIQVLRNFLEGCARVFITLGNTP